MVRRVDIGQMTRQHTERLSRMRRAMLKNTKFILHELLRETTTNIYDTCGKRCSRERLQCIAIESLSASNTGTAHLFDRRVSRTTTEGVWGPQELANLKVHGYGKPLQAIASHCKPQRPNMAAAYKAIPTCHQPRVLRGCQASSLDVSSRLNIACDEK
jgi:hypothetical protein